MKVTLKEERPERILCVPKSVVEHLFAKPKFYDRTRDIYKTIVNIKKYGVFVNRAIAEKTTFQKQVIAYAIIKNNNSILCIKRTRNSNRKALRLRYSLLFGGHVDQAEEGVDNPLISCLERELKEEFGIEIREKPRLIGVVADPTTVVGQLHMGVIFETSIRQESVTVEAGMDNEEFVHSGKKQVHSLLDMKSILHISDMLDPWSQLYLRSRRACDTFSDARFFNSQQYLPLSWK